MRGVGNNCLGDVIPRRHLRLFSPELITPIGSTASLSEHVQLHSAGERSNQHLVKKSAMKSFKILTEAFGDQNFASCICFSKE
ncbi:hypothetical protein TNCV_3732211 [Trichonephila clavipes]|nr:hypothetical protein TNCV_3732211 [Trichonephila clavipes]